MAVNPSPFEAFLVELGVPQLSSQDLMAMTGGVPLREIGSGGYGTAYLLERQPGPSWVVKTVSQEASFETEVRALALVQRLPHVQRLVAVCRDGMFAIVSEYAGMTIDKVESSLLAAHRGRMCQQLGSTLQAAHRLGVAHGDVHLGNVCVALVDGMVCPTLIDWGIAVFVGDPCFEYSAKTDMSDLSEF